jgi:hypothetical protein
MEWFVSYPGNFHDVDCQVAAGWDRFWYNGPEPCWTDVRTFATSSFGSGWVERIEGATCQMIISTEPYTAGLQQTVHGLTPGVGYGFHAALLTIFKAAGLPPQDGKMIKEVGIDPTGGTNPQASTVVWSEPDPHDQGPWDIKRRTAVFAQSSTMTVFIRITSNSGSGGLPYINQSFLDSAILAKTPTVQAVSPSMSQSTSFTVRWDNAMAAPGGYVRWYDVQWMDEANGVWHDWIVQSTSTQAVFRGGVHGHAYRFRARAWQHYENGAHLWGPWSPEGDTRTFVRGPALVGRVLGNEGQPVAGATVSIAGTAYADVSHWQGSYEIYPPPLTGPQVAEVSHSWWLAPAPVGSVMLESNETVEIDWSLRPPDDAVGNGGFESGLAGWATSGSGAVQPQWVSDPVHTGEKSLALGAGPDQAAVVGVRQEVDLDHSWEPSLSFWYRSEGGDPDDEFRVLVTLPGGETRTYRPPLGQDGWQQWTIRPLPEAYFTGAVTLGLEVENDGDATPLTVYVDEVSWGRTPGGPFRFYFPAIYR